MCSLQPWVVGFLSPGRAITRDGIVDPHHEVQRLTRVKAMLKQDIAEVGEAGRSADVEKEGLERKVTE